MKILHAFDIYDPYYGGGTTAILRRVVKGLSDRGHEVSVYTSDIGSKQTESNVKIYPFHCVSDIGNLYVTQGLAEECRDNLKQFDIIHLHCFRSFQNIIIRHYAVKYGIPYVMDAHGSMPRSGKQIRKRLYDTVFGQKILDDASKFIAETKGEAKDYLDMGIKPNRIEIITPPLDIHEYDVLPNPQLFRNKYGIKTAHYVLSLGRIHKIKGLDFLVQGFSELAQKRSDVTLAIAGADAGYKAELEKLIDELGLRDRVVFTGFLIGDDKLSAFRGASVVTQTSVRENGNNMPFEAFLCGTQVISSKNTSAGKDLKQINDGFMVDYGNTSGLASIMNYVLEYPSEARLKAQQGRDYVITNLSVETVAEKYENLYKKIS